MYKLISVVKGEIFIFVENIFGFIICFIIVMILNRINKLIVNELCFCVRVKIFYGMSIEFVLRIGKILIIIINKLSSVVYGIFNN